MNGEFPRESLGYIEMVGDIVSAYVSNNHVASADLPVLIANVHIAVSGLVAGSSVAPTPEPDIAKLTPAQIRRSITPDALISFIDGKSYKTLKRHLTAHGLNPARYRAQYGLPSDYPMVCAAYSDKRSGLALSLGLGRKGGAIVQARKPAARRQKAA